MVAPFFLNNDKKMENIIVQKQWIMEVIGVLDKKVENSACMANWDMLLDKQTSCSFDD